MRKQKKTSSFASGKPKRVQCSTKGCRKYRVSDSEFCAVCSEEKCEEHDPMDAVPRLSEVEVLRFSALDAEIRNYFQGIQIEELQINKEAIEYEARRAKRNRTREELKAMWQAKKAQYMTMVTELAAKFDMDPKLCSIDTDSGIIRDLRGESTD